MTTTVVAASELPFDGINAGDVIPLLLALLLSDCISGKTFWKSYKKWDSLTTEQKTSLLSSGSKILLLKYVLV